MFEFVKKYLGEKNQKINNKNYLNGSIENISSTESIEDIIVKKSEFEPLIWSGGIDKSHDLIIDNNGNYVFRVNRFYQILFTAMLSIPIILTGIFIRIEIYIKDVGFKFDLFLEKGLGAIIMSICSIMIILFLNYAYSSYIFNFQNGYFYDTKLNKKLFELLKNHKYKNKIINIKDIHALQIINFRTSNDKKYYLCYELNMILKDSSRISIVTHGDKEEIIKNALSLGIKLGVKVYDLTQIYFEE